MNEPKRARGGSKRASAKGSADPVAANEGRRMSNREEGGSEVFDVERIRQLVEMMRENDLSEVSLKHGDQRIRLRRGEEPAPVFVTGGSAPLPTAAPAPVAGAVAAAAAAPAAPAAASAAPAGDPPSVQIMKSPMVGTFYTKPNPTSEPYVKVGDHVQASTIVCVVEAMKMFNEIPAGVSGKIVAILAKNEEPVDVNKPLFKIDTQG